MLEKGGALRGGMPLYKFVGNRILSRFQNRMLGASLSEFHSGYRVYSVAALEKIPFQLNTNDFHFDTEIIIQLDARRHADQGAADSDLLRRRDLSRQRSQVRVGRDQGGDRGPVAAAGPVLRPPLRLRAAVARERALRAEARLREPPHRGARAGSGGSARARSRLRRRLRRRDASPAARLPRDRRRQVPARTGRGAGRVRSARSQRRPPAVEFRRFRLRAAARRDRAPGVAGSVRRSAARSAEARAGDASCSSAPRTSGSSSTG